MTHPATFETPTTDTMTGLLSAPYFRHLLREDLLPQALESGDPLSVVLLDIDNFHSINVTYGHDAGDKVLQDVIGALKDHLPDTTIISRYGGDEIAAALPDTRLDDAFTLLEEMRRQVAGMRWDEWVDLQVTCSLGLAACPTHATNDVELVRQADEALFMAKSNGRNRVALPLSDSRMVTKTSHYTDAQLKRLSQLARTAKRNEASLLREALDDLLKKYNDRFSGPPK